MPVSLAGGHHSAAAVLIHFRPHLISQLQILIECLVSRVDFQQDASYMDYLLINLCACLLAAQLGGLAFHPF